jgi:hypothetical protein
MPAAPAARRGRVHPPARHPVLTWTLGAAQLAMLLLFAAYFVCVQINAVAYLAGRRHAIIGGTTPPLPLDSAGAAVADIIAGLVCEAIAAIIVFIAIALSSAAIREAIGRHRSWERTRNPGTP